MHKLPPLNALRVFETVARLGGVRAAAGELCVTPPAVSHQLANLEDWLGAALDPDANTAGKTVISTPASRVRLLVVPTNEELMIARHTLALVAAPATT